MDSSNKRKSPPRVPACSHRLPFDHHQCLELSPHCPQHGGYLSHLNSHHHYPSAAAQGHHHHLQLSPACALHGYLLPHCPIHSSNFNPSNHQSTTIFPNFASIPLPPNPQLSNPNLNSVPPEADINYESESLMMEENNEEEGEEEIIFVLTDEWKEFFAKSEAKRRLAKKQAKKKGKD